MTTYPESGVVNNRFAGPVAGLLTMVTMAATVSFLHQQRPAAQPVGASVAPVAGAAAAVDPVAGQPSEQAFIVATAARLCTVRSSGAADDPPPTGYPGLTDEQVAAYQRRLTTDAFFAERLIAQLRTTCRLAQAPPS